MQLMTSADVAKKLGLTADAVRAAARRGALLPVQVTVGGVRLFDAAALRKFQEEREAREGSRER